MKTLNAWTAACVFAFGLFALNANHAHAADHTDVGGDEATGAADISDLYAWTRDDGNGGKNLVVLLTFGGPFAPGTAAKWSTDVKYTIHLDNKIDADAEDNHEISVRFAAPTAPDTRYGMHVSGLPNDAMVETAVGKARSGEGYTVYAGIHDDPFFFDLNGFIETATTGMISFDKNRDFFAGLNTHAIIVEVPFASVSGDDGKVRVWAATSREAM